MFLEHKSENLVLALSFNSCAIQGQLLQKTVGKKKNTITCLSADLKELTARNARMSLQFETRYKLGTYIYIMNIYLLRTLIFKKASYWIQLFPNQIKFSFLQIIHCPLEQPIPKFIFFAEFTGPYPLEKEMASTPVLLPGEFHAQRSLAGYSSWGRKEPDTTEWLTHTHIPGYFRQRFLLI